MTLPTVAEARNNLAKENVRLRSALKTILMMHDGNQPAALNMPDLDYARRVIMSIHQEAKKALAFSQASREGEA